MLEERRGQHERLRKASKASGKSRPRARVRKKALTRDTVG